MQSQDLTSARSGALKLLRKLIKSGAINKSTLETPGMTSGLSACEIKAIRCEFCPPPPTGPEAAQITEQDLIGVVDGMKIIDLLDGWGNNR